MSVPDRHPGSPHPRHPQSTMALGTHEKAQPPEPLPPPPHGVRQKSGVQHTRGMMLMMVQRSGASAMSLPPTLTTRMSSPVMLSRMKRS